MIVSFSHVFKTVWWSAAVRPIFSQLHSNCRQQYGWQWWVMLHARFRVYYCNWDSSSTVFSRRKICTLRKSFGITISQLKMSDSLIPYVSLMNLCIYVCEEESEMCFSLKQRHQMQVGGQRHLHAVFITASCIYQHTAGCLFSLKAVSLCFTSGCILHVYDASTHLCDVSFAPVCVLVCSSGEWSRCRLPLLLWLCYNKAWFKADQSAPGIMPRPSFPLQPGEMRSLHNIYPGNNDVWFHSLLGVSLRGLFLSTAATERENRQKLCPQEEEKEASDHCL